MTLNEKNQFEKLIDLALAEDIGQCDVTAQLIDEKQQASAKIITREDCIFCGKDYADAVFNAIDGQLTIQWHVKDGDQLIAQTKIATLSGNARSILTAERTVLNFIQTLSATATVTRQYVEEIKHTSCQILDTRKTIPGLRLAQKYAVKTGGGENHRIGLFDGVLIKENHIISAGSINKALANAQRDYPHIALIEVEVESLDELKQAIQSGAKRVLLDNFDIESLKLAVDFTNSKAKLEASGDITLANIKDIAATGVDYISLGSLTKHIKAIDLSMLFEFSEN